MMARVYKRLAIKEFKLPLHLKNGNWAAICAINGFIIFGNQKDFVFSILTACFIHPIHRFDILFTQPIDSIFY